MTIFNKQTFYKVFATAGCATASVITMLITPAAAKQEIPTPKVRSRLTSIVTAKNKQVKFKLPVANATDTTLIANASSGMASWYGPGFNGRLTANGEVYNQEALTAAHPSLEFGTQVEVTNLNNGRSVVVTINDRGPYAGGRIIDLSAAAARSLDMIGTGVAEVQLNVLGR